MWYIVHFVVLTLLCLPSFVLSRRHILVVGIEGSGHHIIEAYAKNLEHVAVFGYSHDTLWSSRGEPESNPSKLASNMHSLLASQNVSESDIVLWGQDSYPEGLDVPLSHPDAVAFSLVSDIKPVILILKRDPVDAFLSAYRRFGLRREERDGFGWRHQLTVSEHMLSLIQCYYNRFCKAESTSAECFTVSFESLVKGNTSELTILSKAFSQSFDTMSEIYIKLSSETRKDKFVLADEKESKLRRTAEEFFAPRYGMFPDLV